MMPVTKSPLRYPGGKTQLHKFVSNLFDINGITSGVYCEPFSGGAGVAVELLFSRKVDRIILNDYDIGIYSIWYAILNDTLRFVELIRNTPITIEEWHIQKAIYLSNKVDEIYSIELAFATFFLNRTNRSGIILGGPIGNLNQTANDKIDCRFNKKSLINKINSIAAERERIDLYNLDAQVLIEEVLTVEDSNSLFTFFDPPYYKQGKNLYTNFFNHNDHEKLAVAIKAMEDFKWITTYDYVEQIKEIYSDTLTKEYQIYYSANRNRKEMEYLFHSNNTIVESFDKVQFVEDLVILEH